MGGFGYGQEQTMQHCYHCKRRLNKIDLQESHWLCRVCRQWLRERIDVPNDGEEKDDHGHP